MNPDSQTLRMYVANHTRTGACICGMCLDAPKDAAKCQPSGDTANVVFFKVKVVDNPDVDSFKQLIVQHKGEFMDIDVFDGAEHNYIDIGAWIGDQSAALAFMGMGNLLGLWELTTPLSMGLPADMCNTLAQNGMISIKANKLAEAVR